MVVRRYSASTHKSSNTPTSYVHAQTRHAEVGTFVDVRELSGVLKGSARACTLLPRRGDSGREAVQRRAALARVLRTEGHPAGLDPETHGSTPHQYGSNSSDATSIRAHSTQVPARPPISSAIPALQNPVPLPSRSTNVVSRAGGPIRTGRRNTVTVAGLSSAASTHPASARQFSVRFPDVSPVTSPVAGPGAAQYGFGSVYPAFERGLNEQQSSPPPLSPALSSPLSAATSSEMHAGHGSSSGPFSAKG
ncbi:hypothetical protein ACEPAG_8842 [Sanghuangporus baumii]